MSKVTWRLFGIREKCIANAGPESIRMVEHERTGMMKHITWTYLSTVKIRSSSPSELKSIIARSAKYGATTETFVVLKVVVVTMPIGLQSSETTHVFIGGSGSSLQPSDEQGSIDYGSATYQLPS
jgi:hypothetical protein